MNITEVRIKLVASRRDKLRAFATITVEDALVIRDVKIIEGPRGLFVAMPSRKLCDRCPSCRGKNPLRARYCSDCGMRLSRGRGELDERGRLRLYADIAHPIHQRGRQELQDCVLAAYRAELLASKSEDYVPQRFEGLDYDEWD